MKHREGRILNICWSAASSAALPVEDAGGLWIRRAERDWVAAGSVTASGSGDSLTISTVVHPHAAVPAFWFSHLPQVTKSKSLA